jgi:hypothetical protein
MNKIKHVFMAEEGGAGGGGTPPAGGTPPTPPAGGGTPAAASWYDSFQNPEVKDWLKAYGEAYPNPEAVATKALNLEKFIGVEKAGRGVVIPKSDAKPEEWRAFYAKVGGVPEKPDGYKVPQTFAADPVVAKFREHAHSVGMPPAFFDQSLSFMEKVIGESAAAKLQEFEAKAEREMTELRSEWGANYDKNTELARRAAKSFIPHANADELSGFLDKIEGAIGAKAAMNLWAKIGQGFAEGEFLGGDGTGGTGGMTVEGAKLRIAELKRDVEFSKKLMNNDAASRAEWDKLHKIAYSAPQ